MTLKARKCPNCGSNEVLEKNGTLVCMNCRTFFDKVSNDIKITKITRDETEIARIQAEERRKNREWDERRENRNWEEHNDRVWFGICIAIIVFFFVFAFFFLH